MTEESGLVGVIPGLSLIYIKDYFSLRVYIISYFQLIKICIIIS